MKFLLSILFFMGISGETTRSGSGGSQGRVTRPQFILEGGCRGIRADSRGDGAFGSVRDGGSSRHNAIDWYAPIGTNIVSPWPGRVEASKPRGSGGAGGFIQILHTNGLTTTYSHLSERLVRTGATVQAGQAIGKVGKTGNAGHQHTHPHVHFAFKRGRSAIDPTNPSYFSCGSYASRSVASKRTPGIPVCRTATGCP